MERFCHPPTQSQSATLSVSVNEEREIIKTNMSHGSSESRASGPTKIAFFVLLRKDDDEDVVIRGRSLALFPGFHSYSREEGSN